MVHSSETGATCYGSVSCGKSEIERGAEKRASFEQAIAEFEVDQNEDALLVELHVRRNRAAESGLMSPVSSPEEFAQLDVFAEETGAQHADRVLEYLTTFPPETAPEILDFAEAMLDETLAGFAAGLRERTTTPESEIEHFITLVRSAYSSRLAVVLMPAAGNG